MKRYHLTTFGCQMNEHDSERMKGMLETLGYEESGERDGADLILFNTCSIRESADNRLIGNLGEAKGLKYEDLVQQPEATLQGLFCYLGVDAAPATVTTVIDTGRRLMQKQQEMHRTSRDDQASIGRWRHDLAPELQEAVEASLADLLPQLGYDPSGPERAL